MEKPVDKCEICNELRYVEKCHIIPCQLNPSLKRLNMYKANLLILCPTHHKLFDKGLLNEHEFGMIRQHVKDIIYVYVRSYKRFERQSNIEPSLTEMPIFKEKVGRGLVEDAWLTNLIKDS